MGDIIDGKASPNQDKLLNEILDVLKDFKLINLIGNHEVIILLQFIN